MTPTLSAVVIAPAYGLRR